MEGREKKTVKKEKKYYNIQRKEKNKQRRKLMRTLKKSEFTDEEAVAIVDALSGKTILGKECESEKIAKMISGGASKEDITEFLKKYKTCRYVLKR